MWQEHAIVPILDIEFLWIFDMFGTLMNASSTCHNTINNHGTAGK